jgi:type I restriction enzyme M protein
MSNISGIIKTIQDIMRKDGGIGGDAQRLEELTWLLFLKIFSDNEEELELIREKYKSPISDKYRWKNWAKNNGGITGDELIDFINEMFIEFKLDDSLIGSIFKDTNHYMKDGHLLRNVINEINKIDFNKTDDRHVFGDIYEQLLSSLQSAGNYGEFYTPRAVTNFIAETLQPKIDDKILDPACGTGGFLSATINYLRAQIKHADNQKLQKNIMGWEYKQFPYNLCITNMLLHDVREPLIKHKDSLARPLNDYTLEDKVDIIVANPPFGGTIKDGIEKNFPIETKETADLFLQLFIRILKPCGKAGIILPDGNLFGDGTKAKIKEKLMTDCNLHTIIRLPNSVFKPYTGIGTNLLFFNKGEPTKEIWFYRLDMPDGYKAFSKTKPIQNEHFEPVKEWLKNKKEIEIDGNFKAKKYNFDEIKANGFNLDLCGFPHAETKVLPPFELMEKYKNERDMVQKEIDDVLKKIKEIMGTK